MKKLLMLLPLLFSLACGSAPRPSKETFAKVKLGMTEAQVSELIGKPASIYVLPDDNALVNWTYSDKDWVNFNAGEVFAVVYDEKDLTQSVPLDQESNYARGPVSSGATAETAAKAKSSAKPKADAPAPASARPEKTESPPTPATPR